MTRRPWQTTFTVVLLFGASVLLAGCPKKPAPAAGTGLSRYDRGTRRLGRARAPDCRQRAYAASAAALAFAKSERSRERTTGFSRLIR